jgi:hypothetical protein
MAPQAKAHLDEDWSCYMPSTVCLLIPRYVYVCVK